MEEIVVHSPRYESLITGVEAEKMAGLPHEFVAIMMIVAHAADATIAVRVGENYPLLGQDYQSKHCGVHANTGAFSLFQSLIPFDQRYLRKTSPRIYEGNNKRHSLELYGQSQLRVSIYKVLQNAQDNKVLIDPETGIVSIIPVEKKLIEQDYTDFDAMIKTIFSIDVKNHRKSSSASISPEEKKQLLPWVDRVNIDKPACWKDEWGDFSDMQHKLYPVDYAVGDENKKPFYVLGDPPFTSDADSFWLLYSVDNDIEKKYPEAFKEYDLSGGCNNDKFIELFNAVVSQIAEKIRVLNDRKNRISVDKKSASASSSYTQTMQRFSSILRQSVINILSSSKNENDSSQSVFDNCNDSNNGFEVDLHYQIKNISELNIGGIVTPAEAAIEFIVNKMWSETSGVKVKQLLMHGPESRNPGIPCQIGNILHMLPNGKIFLTENEAQLIDMILDSDRYFLKKYPVQINPKWKMSEWARVIQAKIDSGMTVNNETMEVFLQYKVNNNFEAFQNHRVTRGNSFTEIFEGGTFFRLDSVMHINESGLDELKSVVSGSDGAGNNFGFDN